MVRSTPLIHFSYPISSQNLAQNYKNNELQIKGQKTKSNQGVKLHHIKHYQKGKAEERDVRQERVKTQRKPAQLKRK